MVTNVDFSDSHPLNKSAAPTDESMPRMTGMQIQATLVGEHLGAYRVKILGDRCHELPTPSARVSGYTQNIHLAIKTVSKKYIN